MSDPIKEVEKKIGIKFCFRLRYHNFQRSFYWEQFVIVSWTYNYPFANLLYPTHTFSIYTANADSASSSHAHCSGWLANRYTRKEIFGQNKVEPPGDHSQPRHAKWCHFRYSFFSFEADRTVFGFQDSFQPRRHKQF